MCVCVINILTYICICVAIRPVSEKQSPLFDELNTHVNQ